MIIIVGIYLRTYRFHDWLYFYPDQARDVTLVGNFLNGKAPLPLMGFRAASTTFDLGAMYYYFQIASGKLFGVRPATMAYPDLFFNILAIPLLYYFLKRYFKTDISLVLTALYSVSFYAIEFSRFAWNPNSMPFFVLLFLLSLWKFLTEKEKTHWGWIAGIGVAVGVGIQLHTILIFLLLSTVLVAFIVSMWNNWRLWNRWMVVIGLILLLNTNQIISETRHNFSNTKKLFSLSAGSAGNNGSNNQLDSLAMDVACHVQANAHIISSLGNKVDCGYLTIVSTMNKQRLLGIPVDMKQIIGTAASLLFSVFGYSFLIYFYRRETDRKKKKFLGLICLYVGLCFVILFPIIASASHLRYFLQLFFVPYFFLGFMLEFIRQKYAKIFIPATFAAGALIVAFNFNTIFAEAKLYAANDHSQSQYVVLGELEHMRDYIISQTGSSKTVYMIADGKYMQNYFYPLQYVLKGKNITLVLERKDLNVIPPDAPLFFVGKKVEGGRVGDTKGFPIRQYQNFGEIGIYILDAQK